MALYEDYIFPPLMELAVKPLRRSCATAVARAQGRVLEIGVGAGGNMGFYSEAVTEVVGIEPVATMLETARRRLTRKPPAFRWDLQQADARALPFADGAFDSVVAILVFCTIPDPEKAAAEAFRVLKPGGKLVFFEHVRGSHAGVARWQERLNPLWKRLACGCEITRDTRLLFEQAGFSFDSLDEWNHERIPRLVAPVISGVASRP